MCYTKICKPLELISVSLTSKVRWSHFNVRMEHAANFFQDTGFIWESNFLPQKVKCHLNVSGFRRLCFCFRRLCLCSIVAVSHNVSCSCGRRPASNKAKSASSREGGRGKHYLRRKSYTMHCGKWSLPCALRIPIRTPNWDRKKSYFASNKLKIKRQQISKAIYTVFLAINVKQRLLQHFIFPRNSRGNIKMVTAYSRTCDAIICQHCEAMRSLPSGHNI